MRVLILMILAFGFLSCDSYDPSKPTTFCKIKGKEISYIINNPPDDTLALKIEVEKFIYSKFSADSIRKEDRTFHFYKADKYLTCDFKEGEPYKKVPWDITLDTIQDLRNHTEIARICFTQSVSKVWYYNYWLRSSKEYDLVENSKRLKFKNIDSLFRVKQKEYGIK